MDFLKNIDPLYIVVCCSLLCVLGIVVGIILPIIGGVFDIFTGILHAVGHIIAGGPLSWCGCLVALAGCGICGALIFGLTRVFSSCGTPDAVNFCRLFGFN